MEQTNPPRLEAALAYTLSGLTTLLWVACVIPAGALLDMFRIEEDATPMHREAILLVPALFLLAVLPVGFTLARRRSGLTALLASTDAFVTLYAGLGFLIRIRPLSPASGVCVGLLLFTAALSGFEVWRSLAGRELGALWRALGGARLALCLLVLIVPSRFLLETGVERASWLGPFALVAISAAGARLARGDRALRRTGAIVQLAVALHLVVTVRYTLFYDTPQYLRLDGPGLATLGLAGAVALAAALHALLLLRTLDARTTLSEAETQLA